MIAIFDCPCAHCPLLALEERPPMLLLEQAQGKANTVLLALERRRGKIRKWMPLIGAIDKDRHERYEKIESSCHVTSPVAEAAFWT